MLNLGTTFDHQPSASTAAVVTLAAPDSTEHPGRAWAIGGIIASVSATTTVTITISNGGTTAFLLDWTPAAADVLCIPFAEPVKGDPNAAVVITVSDPGDGISAKVAVYGAKLVG